MASSLYRVGTLAALFTLTVSCVRNEPVESVQLSREEKKNAEQAMALFDEAKESLNIDLSHPIGSIKDAAYLEGDIFLIDGIGKLVHSISSKDGKMRNVGGTGRGPGEYLNPSSLEVHGDKGWILDQTLYRISQFQKTNEGWLPEISASPALKMSDICFADQNGLWVFGGDGTHLLHRLSSDMASPELSIGSYNADDPLERERVRKGLLACDDQYVVYGYEIDNKIRIYHSQSGDLYREAIFEEIIPLRLSMIDRGGQMATSFKYYVGEAYDDRGNYHDTLVKMESVGNALVVQYQRFFSSVTEERDYYVTIWMNLADLSYNLTYDTPLIVDYLGGGRFLTAYNTPEPALILRSP